MQNSFTKPTKHAEIIYKPNKNSEPKKWRNKRIIHQLWLLNLVT